MDKHQIPVIRSADLQKSGVPTYVGVISASTLNELYDVPERDVAKGTGYQRVPGDTRVKKLAKAIEGKKVDLPTAVLLNVREPVPQNFVRNANVNGFANISIMDLSVLMSSPGNKLYVVDGQHRVKAIEKALESMGGNPNLKIPFVCMVGADENVEMWQFYIVNSNAKAVGTDLTYNLMRERAKHDPEFMKGLIEKGDKWKVIADEIVQALSERSVWKGLIKLANAKKLNTTVPSASFVKSLKPLLTNQGVFEDLKLEQRLQLLEAYWKGIEKYYLASGAKLEERGQYSLFKGIGVSVMNGMLPRFIEHIRSNGDSLFSADAYSKLVEPFFNNLEGDNGLEEPVSGMDYWRAGPAGVVGTFTGGSGQNVLIDRLKTKLPENTYK